MCIEIYFTNKSINLLDNNVYIVGNPLVILYANLNKFKLEFEPNIILSIRALRSNPPLKSQSLFTANTKCWLLYLCRENLFILQKESSRRGDGDCLHSCFSPLACSSICIYRGTHHLYSDHSA